eukprot:scaffold51165_cov32-Tisochrysis_lutea.AAC.7
MLTVSDPLLPPSGDVKRRAAPDCGCYKGTDPFFVSAEGDRYGAHRLNGWAACEIGRLALAACVETSRDRAHPHYFRDLTPSMASTAPGVHRE